MDKKINKKTLMNRTSLEEKKELCYAGLLHDQSASVLVTLWNPWPAESTLHIATRKTRTTKNPPDLHKTCWTHWSVKKKKKVNPLIYKKRV